MSAENLESTKVSFLCQRLRGVASERAGGLENNAHKRTRVTVEEPGEGQQTFADGSFMVRSLDSSTNQVPELRKGKLVHVGKTNDKFVVSDAKGNIGKKYFFFFEKRLKYLDYFGPLAHMNPSFVVFATVQNGTSPLPIGTRVVVRLRVTPGSIVIPKMRWMWAVYTLMSQKELSARQAVNRAIFRLKRLRDRTVKLVCGDLLHIMIYRHSTFTVSKPNIHPTTI